MLHTYTYLLVNFFTVIICFIYSFDKRLKFNRYFTAYLKAAVVVGIPFILWDVCFTKMGVWWFNTDYTLGINLLGLPIEEWLFFICIPFSCTFTYYSVTRFFNLNWINYFNSIIAFLTIITCSVVALLYPEKAYTFLTAILTSLSMFLFYFIFRVKWIGEASLVFSILMLGFLPVNGILTGTGLESPIVNYNPAEFLTIRLGTIPLEDVVYGYTQFMWIIFFFKRFGPKTTPSFHQEKR